MVQQRQRAVQVRGAGAMTRATILLVEDNALTRKLVRFALERKGHSVLEATSGASALSLLESQAADLVLQDLVLPDVDGFELIKRLRALPNGMDAPILAFSGLLSKHDEARMATAGFDDVIALPIAGDDVTGRISRQIGVIQTYYETATYFGPDRRNRDGGPERSTSSDHGGGQFRRIEIMRNPDTGVDVIRDDAVQTAETISI